MSYLVDTSILVRLANRGDVLHTCALDAVVKLHRAKEALCITAQNLIEFRNVATRPTEVNGLGLSSQNALTISQAFEMQFLLLEETPTIYGQWKRIVEGVGVLGKQVHDARLVAVCCANTIDHILTFNTAHFARIAQFAGSIIAVDPRQLKLA